MRHPLRPPLLPYTTLFRSCLERSFIVQTSGSIPAAAIRLPRLTHIEGSLKLGEGVPIVEVPNLQTIVGALTIDRKSTRLNSSHLVISYAVFCLQKKNKLVI